MLNREKDLSSEAVLHKRLRPTSAQAIRSTGIAKDTVTGKSSERIWPSSHRNEQAIKLPETAQTCSCNENHGQQALRHDTLSVPQRGIIVLPCRILGSRSWDRTKNYKEPLPSWLIVFNSGIGKSKTGVANLAVQCLHDFDESTRLEQVPCLSRMEKNKMQRA